MIIYNSILKICKFDYYFIILLFYYLFKNFLFYENDINGIKWYIRESAFS